MKNRTCLTLWKVLNLKKWQNIAIFHVMKWYASRIDICIVGHKAEDSTMAQCYQKSSRNCWRLFSNFSKIYKIPFERERTFLFSQIEFFDQSNSNNLLLVIFLKKYWAYLKKEKKGKIRSHVLSWIFLNSSNL